MKTVVEFGKDGSRTVFHRTDGGAWTHPEGNPYRKEFGVVKPCPGCAKAIGRPRRTELEDLERARRDRARKREKRLVRPGTMSAETPSPVLGPSEVVA